MMTYNSSKEWTHVNRPHLLASSAFLFLIASNYMLQSVRETIASGMTISGPVLVGSSALASLLVATLMTSDATTLYSENIKVYLLIQIWGVGIGCAIFLTWSDFTGALFFITSSVATMLCASFLWGLMNSRELNLKGYFHEFSLAANIGQVLGSGMSYFVTVAIDEIINRNRVLLLLSSIFCTISAQCVWNLRTIEKNLPIKEVQIKQISNKSQSVYLENPLLVTGIAALQILSCFAASLLYLDKLDIIQNLGVRDSISLGAGLNLTIACVIVIIQISGIGKALPSNVSLLLLPILTSISLVSTALYSNESSLNSTYWLIFLNRVLSYAVSKPTREGLYGSLSEADRIKSKPMVDSIACKLGTAAASPFYSITKGNLLPTSGILLLWILVTHRVSSMSKNVDENIEMKEKPE